MVRRLTIFGFRDGLMLKHPTSCTQGIYIVRTITRKTFLMRQPWDYPDFIRPAAKAVARGECERGILLGGSGNGEAISANKVRGVRCALCWSEDTARLSREHNDANVISIGQRTISRELALRLVEIWLVTPFEGGRHVARIRKIEAE